MQVANAGWAGVRLPKESPIALVEPVSFRISTCDDVFLE